MKLTVYVNETNGDYGLVAEDEGGLYMKLLNEQRAWTQPVKLAEFELTADALDNLSVDLRDLVPVQQSKENWLSAVAELKGKLK